MRMHCRLLAAIGLAIAGLPSAAPAATPWFASGATRVWWLDAERREVVDSVALEQAGPLALRHDGAVLYAGSLGDRPPFRVVAIDTATRAVEPLVSLPGVPHALALSADGTRLWVAHSAARCDATGCTGLWGVSVVDVPMRAVRATFTRQAEAQLGPAAIVVTPDGTRVYFVDPYNSHVGVIDAGALTLLDPVPSYCCLGSAIAVSPNGATVHALGNEFGGFMLTVDVATHQSRDTYIREPFASEPIDFQFDVEIGADNVTAYMPSSECGRQGCADALLLYDTAQGAVRAEIPLDVAPSRVALTAGDRLALLSGVEGVVTVVDLAARTIAGSIPIGEPVRDLATLRWCAGDCDRSGEVTIEELVGGVRIAAGAGIDECRAADRDAGGTVTIDELVSAVRNLLEGC